VVKLENKFRSTEITYAISAGLFAIAFFTLFDNRSKGNVKEVEQEGERMEH